jgi:hypothetical protein
MGCEVSSQDTRQNRGRDIGHMWGMFVVSFRNNLEVFQNGVLTHTIAMTPV